MAMRRNLAGPGIVGEAEAEASPSAPRLKIIFYQLRVPEIDNSLERNLVTLGASLLLFCASWRKLG